MNNKEIKIKFEDSRNKKELIVYVHDTDVCEAKRNYLCVNEEEVKRMLPYFKKKKNRRFELICCGTNKYDRMWGFL